MEIQASQPSQASSQDQYEELKKTLRKHAMDGNWEECIREDPRRKKKKRKKKTKADQESEDIMISFKPLATCRMKDSQGTDPKHIPLPYEDEFCALCPVKFYPIQIEAVRWMYWIERSKKADQHVGGILGDVMGLGKTIDALGITAYDYFAHIASEDLQKDQADTLFRSNPSAPTLIITTLTVIHQWRTEIVEKFGFPEKYVMVYHGAKRHEKYDHLCERGWEPQLLITNYETVQKDYEDQDNPLFRTYWKRTLIDEAHIARNPKTNTYRALQALRADAKWCITGTPIVNYPDDIRRLSQLCTPAFPLYCGSSLQESRWKSLFLLRRTKDLLPLPTMRQEDVWLELTDREAQNYSKLEAWAQTVYEELVSTNSLNQKYQKILLVLVRLRQACDHLLLQEGYAFTSLILDKIKKKFKVQDICFKKKSQNHQAIEDWKDDSDDDDTDFFLSNDRCKEKDHSVEDDRIIPDDCEDLKACSNLSESAQELLKSGSVGLTSDNPGFEYSTKLIFIRNFIKEKLLGGDMYKKIVIFAQFTTMLDLIEAMLIQEGIKSLRFDGRIQKPEIRSKIIQMFDDEPEYRIILTSLKAGGVGLNLVAANCLFLVDPWWNRSVELQAFDRVHRIGQKHPVHVFRLLIRGSIEEEVLKIQEKKNNQENSFYDMDCEKVLSIKDIHCVFNTMRVRQLKNNKQG